ncbi:MAG: integrase arm-type DNA-binding domain-containing protein, partial [Methylobacteriaceae bacterium]|nr:integrase arm-type DNA-binding domain-containing protein [Methylobacteriaceae bacterium]
MKLTKRAIDAIQPGEKRVPIWDDELPGFGIRVNRNGHSVYVLKYRADGRQGWFTIGKHGAPWTPEQARKEALRLLGEVALGGDPARKRKEERTAITVAELCDQYLAEGVAHKKALTLKSDRGRVEHHIKPLLGNRRVASLTRADIEKLLSDVIRGKTAAKVPGKNRAPGTLPKGGQGVGAQCVVLMGTLLSFAKARGIREDDPAHGVKKPAVRKLERFLTRDEIRRFATALKVECERAPYECAAITLLLFTGCRRSEILTLKWRQVDFEREMLLLPDSKSGAKPVYLNAPAIDLLKQIPRVDGNPYVIIGKREGSH